MKFYCYAILAVVCCLVSATGSSFHSLEATNRFVGLGKASIVQSSLHLGDAPIVHLHVEWTKYSKTGSTCPKTWKRVVASFNQPAKDDSALAASQIAVLATKISLRAGEGWISTSHYRATERLRLRTLATIGSFSKDKQEIALCCEGRDLLEAGRLKDDSGSYAMFLGYGSCRDIYILARYSGGKKRWLGKLHYDSTLDSWQIVDIDQRVKCTPDVGVIE